MLTWTEACSGAGVPAALTWQLRLAWPGGARQLREHIPTICGLVHVDSGCPRMPDGVERGKELGAVPRGGLR